MESEKKSNGGDAIALLKADHRKVEELFGRRKVQERGGQEQVSRRHLP